MVERRQTLPVLANLLVQVQDGRLSLTGTDLDGNPVTPGLPMALLAEVTQAIADEIDALGAEHERHDERARPVGILDADPVDLGDRLREKRRRLEEPGRFDTAERERDPRADPRHDGGRTDGSAPARDSREVATLENPHDLGGRCVRMTDADTAQMREHDRSLHGEHAIERADRKGMLGRSFGWQTARPRRIVGEGVDAVDSLGHAHNRTTPRRARAEKRGGAPFR